MTESYLQARRAALQGIVETAGVLAARSVEDGEDLGDVVAGLDALRRMLAGKDPPLSRSTRPLFGQAELGPRGGT